MPFKSKAQQIYLGINKPGVAKKFAADAKKTAPPKKPGKLGGFAAAFGK